MHSVPCCGTGNQTQYSVIIYTNNVILIKQTKISDIIWIKTIGWQRRERSSDIGGPACSLQDPQCLKCELKQSAGRGVNALQTLGVLHTAYRTPNVWSVSCKLYAPPVSPGNLAGHQMHYGTFWGKSKAFPGTDVLYCLCCKLPHRYRLVLRQHQPHNQSRWRK